MKSDNGVCTLYYLATQRNKKPFASIQIRDNCDADFSIPTYEYSDYLFNDTTNSLVITSVSERAPDKYLTDDGQFKRFKQGFNQDNVEMISDTVKRQVMVLGNGVIKESKIKP